MDQFIYENVTTEVEQRLALETSDILISLNSEPANIWDPSQASPLVLNQDFNPEFNPSSPFISPTSPAITSLFNTYNYSPSFSQITSPNLNQMPFLVSSPFNNYYYPDFNLGPQHLAYRPPTPFPTPRPQKIDGRFTCPEPDCGRVFDKAKNLNSHITKHSSEKPFKCRLCPESLKRKGDLLRHIRVCHGKSEVGKRLDCAYCPSFRASDLNSIYSHLQGCHNGNPEAMQFSKVLETVLSFKKRPSKKEAKVN